MSEVASAFVTIAPSFKGGGRAIQKEFEGSLDGNAAGKKAGTGFMGGFGGSVKALAGGLAAGFAGGALVSGIMSSINAASDLSETINKSTVIFGENSGAIDKWARGAATSMGLSRQAALNAASGFGDMFSQLGFSGDLAASMSQDVVLLSADLGSFNNLGTEDVAQRISAAFRGEYDSLQPLIPNINAARVEQEAMAMTGKRNAKELTAQEKAAATLAIVQKDGARAMGDFARTSDGVANKQKILSARMDDAKAKFGELLLPVKSLALDGFMALMDWGERLGPTFQAIGDVVSGFFGILRDGNVSGALKSLFNLDDGQAAGVASTFTAIKDAVMTAFGAVKDFILNQFIPAFMTVVSAVRGWYDAVVPIVVQFVQGVMSNLEPMLPKIMAIFGTVGSIITGAMQIIAAVIQGATAFISAWWAIWGDSIISIVSATWSAVIGIIGPVLYMVRSIIATVLAVIRGDWSGAWDGIKGILAASWAFMSGIVTGAVGIIRALISGLMSAVSSLFSAGWNAAKSVVSSAWSAIKSAVSSGVSSVMSLVSSLPGRIVGALGNLGSLLYAKGAQLIQGLIDGIMSKISAIGSAMSGVASKIAGFLPGSPVKEGPLTSWNNGGAGKRLGGLLADGLDASQAAVAAASARMASAVSVGSVSMDIGSAASSAGGLEPVAIRAALDGATLRLGPVDSITREVTAQLVTAYSRSV